MNTKPDVDVDVDASPDADANPNPSPNPNLNPSPSEQPTPVTPEFTLAVTEPPIVEPSVTGPLTIEAAPAAANPSVIEPAPIIPESASAVPEPAPVTSEPAPTASAVPAPARRPARWPKFLRVLLWGAVIILLALGLGLFGASRTLQSASQGTSSALQNLARILLWSGGILGVLNLIWGAVRWFLRWHAEHWHFGRVLGKLIGGGIWRAIVIAPLFAVLLLIVAPFFSQYISAQTIADAQLATTSAEARLDTAYAAGAITADEYVKYLIAADYNPNALPEQYRGELITDPTDILDFVEQHLEELSSDTLLDLLQIFSLSHITFGTDASGNIGNNTDGRSSTSPSATAARQSLGATSLAPSAFAAADVKTLNQVILSSSQRFLIFYTDTGTDQIDAAAAANIGDMLERLIDRYQQQLGLTYHYDQIEFHSGFLGSKYHAMENLLEARGIDKSHLQTAMPVYIINPFGSASRTLASYVGRRFDELGTRILMTLGSLLGDAETKDLFNFYETSPTLPFINILPGNLSSPALEVVTAHELGHHFAMNYCYDTFQSKCSDNDFVAETFPQLAALLTVMPTYDGNFLDAWHSSYVYDANLPIDDPEHEGYASFAFLYWYQQIVPNGLTHILNAMHADNAYWYLYEQAGAENIKNILHQLATHNLTNAYGSARALYSDKTPQGSAPAGGQDAGSYAWSSSSIHYYYLPLASVANQVLTISGLNTNYYEPIFLGQRGQTYTEIPASTFWRSAADATTSTADSTAATTLSTAAPDVAGRTASAYQVTFADYLDTYDTIVIAITDFEPSHDAGAGFTMALEDAEIAQLPTDDDTVAESSEYFFGSYGNCLWFYTDSLFDISGEFIDLFKGARSDIDDAIAAWHEQAEQAKTQIGNRKITLCGRQTRPLADFDNFRANLSSKYFQFTALTLNEPDFQMALVIDFDPFSNVSIIKMLMQDSASFRLITATIE